MLVGIAIGGVIVAVCFIVVLYFLYKRMMKVNSRAYKKKQNKGIEE